MAVALSLRIAKVAQRGKAAKDNGAGTEAHRPAGDGTPAIEPEPSAQPPAAAVTSAAAAPAAAAFATPALVAAAPAPAPAATTAAAKSMAQTPVTAKPAPTSARAAPRGDDITPLQPPEVFARLFDLALGKARPASSVSSGHVEVVAATALALQDTATQERYAPRRPNMLPRILSASSDESFSSRELSALIAHDPSLVGNVLKIANSSYYRVSTEPVESVARAVNLLGTDGIRSVVTAALMQPIFRIGGADFPRYPEIAWEHTFRSASAAIPYNFLVERSDPGAAELLCLVMGLAGIVIFRVTLDQYSRYPRLRPDAGVMSSLLDAHAADMARRIGASWELSEATLAGLDGQIVSTTKYPSALGRSIYFGRVVGALAVLRLNHALDEETAKASIPPTSMPEQQVERMWARLTPKPEKK